MHMMHSLWLLLAALLLVPVCHAQDATLADQFRTELPGPPIFATTTRVEPPAIALQANKARLHPIAQTPESRLVVLGNRAVSSSVDSVIVRFDSDQDYSGSPSRRAESRFRGLSAKTKDVMGSLGAKLSKVWCNSRFGLVKLGPNTDVPAAMHSLKARPEFRYAVPDHAISLAEYIPNDPRFGEQWALANERIA